MQEVSLLLSGRRRGRRGRSGARPEARNGNRNAGRGRRAGRQAGGRQGATANAKKSEVGRPKVDPPYQSEVGFPARGMGVVWYRTQTVYTPHMILYLYQMGWYTISIQNRLHHGPIFGVSRAVEVDHIEWGIYLGLISIHIRYF